jgi:hypothetical protein
VLEQHEDPGLTFALASERHREDEIALLLTEVGGDEGARDTLGAREVELLGKGGLDDAEEVTEVGGVFEQPEGAPIAELADDLPAGAR